MSGLLKHLFPLAIPPTIIAMLAPKIFVILLALCVVHQSVSKPTPENELTEGRGIMSTIWGWITYPFTWWSSESSEQSVTERLIGSTTVSPNQSLQSSKHNVTILCNDQTCTTMKCDGAQCKNITCNLYDTDLRGECREYNIIPVEPQEHTILQSTDATIKIPIQSETTETIQVNSKNPNNEKVNPLVEEHPLELEVVLSSTVNSQDTISNSENIEEGTIPEKM